MEKISATFSKTLILVIEAAKTVRKENDKSAELTIPATAIMLKTVYTPLVIYNSSGSICGFLYVTLPIMLIPKTATHRSMCITNAIFIAFLIFKLESSFSCIVVFKICQPQGLAIRFYFNFKISTPDLQDVNLHNIVIR